MPQPGINNVIDIQIYITSGEALSVTVESNNLNDFIKQLNESIADQSPIQINDRTFINGRHIVRFDF